jgi:hypothetical protein
MRAYNTENQFVVIYYTTLARICTSNCQTHATSTLKSHRTVCIQSFHLWQCEVGTSALTSATYNSRSFICEVWREKECIVIRKASLPSQRRMRWAGHVTRMGEERSCTRFWWESQKERDHSEDQGVGGKMGSEWILGRLAWGGGLDSTGSG